MKRFKKISKTSILLLVVFVLGSMPTLQAFQFEQSCTTEKQISCSCCCSMEQSSDALDLEYLNDRCCCAMTNQEPATEVPYVAQIIPVAKTDYAVNNNSENIQFEYTCKIKTNLDYDLLPQIHAPPGAFAINEYPGDPDWGHLGFWRWVQHGLLAAHTP